MVPDKDRLYQDSMKLLGQAFGLACLADARQKIVKRPKTRKPNKLPNSNKRLSTTEVVQTRIQYIDVDVTEVVQTWIRISGKYNDT